MRLLSPSPRNARGAGLHAPFDHPDWLFELKLDGFRGVLYVENRAARLGRDLRNLPLIERKALLKPLVRPPALYVDHIAGRGVDLFNAVCERDMEGIVAKLGHGRCEPEASTWVKVKNRKYSQNDGRRELFERKRRAAGA